MISFYGLNRRSNKILATLFVLLAVTGCANSGQLFSSSSKEIQGCVKSVAANAATNVEMVNYAVQDCLGEAVTIEARLARTHAAVMILANYGARSIKLTHLEDSEAASDQAQILKARVEKALTKLEKLKAIKKKLEADEVGIQTAYPTYRPMAIRQPADVQLYGVARAALSPAAWRLRKVFRVYAKSATGGLSGVLTTALKRRGTIKAKIKSGLATLELGQAAMFDTRCLMVAIDTKYKKGSENGTIPSKVLVDEDGKPLKDESGAEVPKTCKVTDKNVDVDKVWVATSKWISEALFDLDKLENPS